ncbi:MULTISPECIES: tRNA pseudouridine(54/55) synthase Pus10 [unclassified Haladaptatus]|uniref:tRNA pseudouridine(54/55) synthase Pus10 n=1 Tax=unclassified Haladaptatus TaxID=2622732 RepID=UPI00209C55D2|nr:MULTISPECIES: tRNA pseudouridine(54/55) synthase Pus10 [unclassified Haladaptatus]MCO8243256.1 tRNA pseudouridine(54/55) synthase Pus10 [Haladaptatus sp. AB643]MCO8252967.1 tRNA pseudouridine(54/55) synthase Pus10 [Haladaptatus sp. AB618]
MDVLSAARRVIAEDPVCDACLGRQFADRSFGLTNTDRGHSLRVAVALEDDEDFEEPDEECWVCEGLIDEFDAYAEQVAEALADVEFETYQVGTRAPPLVEENEILLRELADLPEDTGELFKSEFNREVGKRVGRLTDTEVDFDRPDVLALLNLERGDVDVQVNPAFVFGRYRKLERDIPQTKWPCRECGGSGKQLAEGGGEESCDYCGGSGFLYDESVEQLTTPPVLEAMDGKEAIFHGAGREDVDALMLGTGRPFAIEVKKPQRRRPDTDELETEINEFADGKAEVDSLTLATHDMVERVKGLDASKTYRAQVEFDEAVTEEDLAAAIEELDGATVDQFTPNRVDHRRANLTRVREVYSIVGHMDDERHGEVEIHGEGGLYIKELISGDEGRTEPSLAGLLGVGAEVTALDVVAVEGEDEIFGHDDYLKE